MKTVLLQAKKVAYELGVLFANTLTSAGPVSNQQK